MIRPLCFNILLSLPVSSFLSLLPLFPFALIPVSFRSYPCFLSLLPLFPSVPIPCFLSLLCTFSYFLVVLACPILAIYSAYIKRYKFRMLPFVVLFALLYVLFLSCLHPFAFSLRRSRRQLKAKTRTPYCLSPTPDVACGKFKVFSLPALRLLVNSAMLFNAVCFACAALILV